MTATENRLFSVLFSNPIGDQTPTPVRHARFFASLTTVLRSAPRPDLRKIFLVMASEQETSQRKHGSFFHKLAARAAEVDSLLCVGLDPHQSELGNDCNAAGLRAFCGRIIEATSGVALAYKPNSAFFEAFGVRTIE